jgi:hypothetical protein
MQRLTITTRIALSALMYREMFLGGVFGLSSHEELLEWIECNPGEVSQATLAGSTYLNADDWSVLRQLRERAAFLRTARKIATADPFRAEVLLHACPPHGMRSQRRWATDLVRRWDAIERAMAALREEGFTTTRDDVEEIAVDVYKHVTGKSHSDYLDEYEEHMFPEYARG